MSPAPICLHCLIIVLVMPMVKNEEIVDEKPITIVAVNDGERELDAIDAQ